VLIVGRGGGSLEDLWAFNEEPVVRAIAGSRIPVISAVGHEVDTTLADLAADVRAATPSNAAEIAVRDAKDLQHRLDVLTDRAGRAARKSVGERRRHLDSLLAKYGFRRVRDLFATFQQTVDLHRERIDDAIRSRLAAWRGGVDALVRAYGLREFPRRIAEHRTGIATASKRLTNAAVAQVLNERRRTVALEDRLRALSPRAVLERGYSLVRTAEGRLVRGADTLTAGAHVSIEFARGEAEAVIEKVAMGGTHAAEEDR
jgi:exodeoxyribonuclease VII large subunit